MGTTPDKENGAGRVVEFHEEKKGEIDGEEENDGFGDFMEAPEDGGYAEINSDASDKEDCQNEEDDDDYDEEGYGALDQDDQIGFGNADDNKENSRSNRGNNGARFTRNKSTPETSKP